MQGTIKRIWENQSKKGETYWVLLIDGKRFSLWDRNLLQGLKEGERVDFLWKHDRQYKKIININTLSNGNEKDIQIIRMSCIRSAAELLSDMILSLDEKSEVAINLARQFESYVLGKEEGG
jgi:hypothetical protein